MVAAKAIRTAWTILTVSAAFGVAVPALAHPDPAPSLAYCEAIPQQEFDFEWDGEKSFAVPQEWSAFAAASNRWMAVATTAGTTECVDLSWMFEGEDFEIHQDRFVGFSWVGYEAFGYTLVDRAGTGTVLDTGHRPVFSPNGFRMAALQSSESGYGGLEGFGVWYVYETGLKPIYLNSAVPFMTDWRIDRWEGDDCLHISAIPFDRVEDWEDLSQYERDSFVSGDAGGWALKPGTACPTP
ncbi:hypothetical protein [Erythrobacter sp. JK5]|uniref:hypothetical protein n=1 Tax=Erythrobacter sp. JK5 TaxID=2829500 RepID=UPI001BA7BF74|nr:hypothetical protein [Erythrobacter sp. JK5]QUL36516.1 hypothetical protein KDC96_08645 [Erythrobacter sp. JK5]